jgi:hypothetical protein
MTEDGHQAPSAELPIEAPDADVVEQRTPAVPDDELDDVDEVVEIDTVIEADPADVLEQSVPVPLDEEEANH